MGLEQKSGIRTKMDGQPMPKPGNQLENHLLLKVAGTVIAVVGAIVIANEAVNRAKRFIQGGTETARLLIDD